MRILSIIMAICLPLAALAQDASKIFDEKPRLIAKARQKSPLEKRIIKTSETLDKELEKVDFKDVEFESIIKDFFLEQHDLNISLHKVPAGLLPTKITLSIEDTTVEDVLEIVLDILSENMLTKEEEITYCVLKGRIIISTSAYFEKKMVRRFYSVANITTGTPYYMNAPEIGLDTNDRDALQERLEGLPHQAGRHVDPRQNAEELLDELIYTLKTVRPETWQENGGKGTVTTVGSKLIIYQSIEMQKTIGGKWW